MFVDTLLAFGLLLTTASQLRFGDLPIGPGELCLVTWLFLMLLRQLGQSGPQLSPALSRLLVFWTAFAVSLCLGLLMGLLIGQQYDPRWVIHDVLAYPLLAAVSCMSVVEPGARLRLRRTAWLLVTFGTVSLALQVAAGMEMISIPVIQPWFWERFRGWSANPNQLSLLCGVLALLALYLGETAIGWSARIVALACSILPICVGRMTMSDTFTLALIVSIPVFITLKLWEWLRFSGHGSPMRFAFACTVAVGLPMLAVSLVPLGMVAASDAGIFAMELTKNGGKQLQQESDLRMSLWSQAIRLGIDSSMLGLGPGPHLEIPASIVIDRMTQYQPENLEHPQQGSAPNFEAHNTFLDLLTQGGIIAVLSFVWIVSVSAWGSFKARQVGLTTLMCGLTTFCMTGLIVRQPLFWFSIALCLVAEASPLRNMFQRGREGAFQ
jgi:O-antigen ligase